MLLGSGLLPNIGITSNSRILTGATWAVDGSGRAYNTPTLGAELLTDGDMEAGGVAAWPDYSTPTTKEKSTEQFLGAQSLKIVTSGSNRGAIQTISVSPNQWHRLEASAYRVSGTMQVADKTSSQWEPNLTLAYTSASWVAQVFTGRTIGSSAFIYLTGSNAINGYFDNVTLKQLIASTLFCYTQSTGYPTVPPTVRIATMVSNTQAGVVGWLDDPTNPQNGIFAIRNGSGNINLTKLVAGTYTPLQSITSAHVADAPIYIERTAATTFQLWHNGSQIGIDQTITDSAIVDNTTPYFGAFSTYSGNLFSATNGFTLNGFPYAFPGA